MTLLVGCELIIGAAIIGVCGELMLPQRWFHPMSDVTPD